MLFIQRVWPAAPYVAVAGNPVKVMVWVAALTLMDCETEVAGL